MTAQDNGPSWARVGMDSWEVNYTFAAIAPQRTDDTDRESIVIDLDELHRTGSTRIRGFRHNLYKPEPGPGEIADCG